jgi:glutamate/tyrosine decarboxylase-like PLP-dependent enzyme
VSTGAVDPLPQIAALCRAQKLWFHVDGAYGGLAATVPEAPADLRALSEADSVAVDPHKWLYTPLEAGCALVRNPEHHRAAFSYHPPYFVFGEETVNLVDRGLQNSRGFRALKVWLGLRQTGAEGALRMISDDILLSRRMAEAVTAHPEMELWTQALSITTFRFVPSDLRASLGREEIEKYLDQLNKSLLEKSQARGEVFVTNAVIRDRFLLRACICNFHTDVADVLAMPEILAKTGRELDRTLRPKELAAR